MAPKLFSHRCLLAPMIWCDFYHFRISGSIVCRQILHSLTDVMKGASPFATNKIITVTVTVTVYRLHSTFGDLFEDAGRQAVQVPGHTVVVVSDVEVPAVTFIPKSA